VDSASGSAGASVVAEARCELKAPTPKLCWLIALLAVAAMPPLPPRHHKPFAYQGAGAKDLLAKKSPARPMLVIQVGKKLVWDWTPDAQNPASNVVFLIRSNSTLMAVRYSYPVVAVVKTNEWPFTVDQSKQSVFFVVTSSNTATHLESP